MILDRDTRHDILAIAATLRERGLQVRYWIEIDEPTLAAVLIFAVRGDGLPGEETALSEFLGVLPMALAGRIGHISVALSKGRGRPKKTGAPPTEGMTIRCVLRDS